MKVFGISFTTTHFGNGVALAIARNANEAFQYLKTMGSLNATPEEYQLISATVVSCSLSFQPTLVYENLGGVVTITGPKGEDGKDGDFLPYSRPSKIEDFLYEISYDTYSYDYAKDYFLNKNPQINPAGCSSIRQGNFYGRNLDWYYNNGAEFIIRTSKFNDRFATIGVAGSLATLTKSRVEEYVNLEEYKILPFYTLDGINERGVVCNINVVPFEGITEEGTTPFIQKRETLCITMLPRYILDKFATATDAVQYIRDYVSVYVPKAMSAQGYGAHIMVADKNTTYILEMVGDEIRVTTHNKMTNFRIDGVIFNSDGTVYTQETSDDTHNPVITNNISLHGSGLERYNILARATGITSKETMRNLMNRLLYTAAYKKTTSPMWYSEFVDASRGIDLTTNITDPKLIDFMGLAFEAYRNRSRETGKTWHTTHSVIYDFEKLTLYIVPQENTAVEYTRALETSFDMSRIEAIESKIPVDAAPYNRLVTESYAYEIANSSAPYIIDYGETVDPNEFYAMMGQFRPVFLHVHNIIYPLYSFSTDNDQTFELSFHGEYEDKNYEWVYNDRRGGWDELEGRGFATNFHVDNVTDKKADKAITLQYKTVTYSKVKSAYDAGTSIYLQYQTPANTELLHLIGIDQNYALFGAALPNLEVPIDADRAKVVFIWIGNGVANIVKEYDLASLLYIQEELTLVENRLNNSKEDKHFVATYGETSFANILKAVRDGKIVLLSYNNNIGSLINVDSNGAKFSITLYKSITEVSVSSTNSWSARTWNGDNYTLPTADVDKLGGVKVGEGLKIKSDGTLSVDGGGSPTIPIATSSRLGGVKIGAGIDVNEAGVISVPYNGQVEIGVTPFADIVNEFLTKQKYFTAIKQGNNYRGKIYYVTYCDSHKVTFTHYSNDGLDVWSVNDFNVWTHEIN